MSSNDLTDADIVIDYDIALINFRIKFNFNIKKMWLKLSLKLLFYTFCIVIFFDALNGMVQENSWNYFITQFYA